jgi:Fe-S-cluster-containing dehydrogenase component
MSKWNLIIDVARCENCHNCTLATKDEFVGNDFPGYAAPQPLHGHEWIRIHKRVRGEGSMVDVAYLPTMCNHCDDAPCMKAAKDGAVTKRADGIIIIDPQKAKGQRQIVDACPYGAVSWNEELQLPQIWIFDAHLLDAGWKEPRCAQSCPTGVFKATKLEDEAMRALARTENLEVLLPELGTKPRVYYKHLHRYERCFIGGAVVASDDGITDCVADARVRLLKDGNLIAETTTDVFGDFKFDGLTPRSGRYQIEVAHPGSGNATIDVELGEDSRYVELIELSAG